MKIPATLGESSAKMTVKMRRSVRDDITRYAQLFAETYGHEISENTLVDYMLAEYMTADKAFQKWKKTAKRDQEPIDSAPSAANSRFDSAPEVRNAS